MRIQSLSFSLFSREPYKGSWIKIQNQNEEEKALASIGKRKRWSCDSLSRMSSDEG